MMLRDKSFVQRYHLKLAIFTLVLLLILPKLIFVWVFPFESTLQYPFDKTVQPVTLTILLLVSSLYLVYIYFHRRSFELFKITKDYMKALSVCYFISCLMDIIWLIEKGWCNKLASFLDNAVVSFFFETKISHLIVLLYLIIISALLCLFSKEVSFRLNERFLEILCNISVIVLVLLTLLSSAYFIIYAHSNEVYFIVPISMLTILVYSFIITEIALLAGAAYLYISGLINRQGRVHVIFTAILSVILILPSLIEARKLGGTSSHLVYFFKIHAGELAVIAFPLYIMLFILFLIKKLLKPSYVLKGKKTSGEFGSASFATQKDLERAELYDNTDFILSGKDERGRRIHLPLKNKLTLSPQGGGKTTCSTINVLLSHPGNTFIFDIKGELWATTARYRMQTFGKEVIVIDPYGITKSKDFAKGKPEGLLKEYCFNPFDWIPEDQATRDRMINAFASSFIINEGGTVQHFDDNAKILIRGFIDYIMQALPKEARNLNTLYELLSEHQDHAQETFQQMSNLQGRAKAAANQITRVGVDERGSILSTSYRQIDWMSDYNVQACLARSNFDLRQFITGNMDIYVVLPEDQIKEHQRFVRMILSLIMSFIVQMNPSELPQVKMLFLLDELAQLGYCPDVEQAIEVLRARKLVVWTVFQTLSQIKLYKKPDLFMGAPIKQIFTNDDVETMQWVQTLGGKKTILTKTRSNNEGDSRQKMQLIGGSISTGEGESIQETGVDLIHLNQIRELGPDEQFIFMHGLRPIKCKKVPYFENDFFKGKFDLNPIEK